MRTSGGLTIAFALSSLMLVSSVASAQVIRTYGDKAEAQYGTPQSTAPSTTVNAAQGQVAPVQTAAPPATADGQQAATGGEGAEGQQEVEPSYVTVFNPGGAQAPLPVDLTPEKMYSGIIPGTRDEVSHLNDAIEKGQDRSNKNRLTWVGFHARDDVTRVFFQTAREADYDLGEENGAVTITFNNTVVSAYNFRRFVDSSFFDRNVTRVEVNRVDKNTVKATIMLRQYERPDIDRNGKYLYVDFSGQKMAAQNDAANQ